MPAFLREYGVIMVLMIVALGGYFLIGDRRGEIMDYTLDMLGTRLVELASGEEEKEQIAQQFAAFSDRVDRKEVSPETIESIAANVLNLRARGAVITPEEAELMLYQEPVRPLPAPGTPDSPGTSRAYAYSISSDSEEVTRVDLQNLGQKMTYMFELADAVHSENHSEPPTIHFNRDEHGIHVVVDPSMSNMFESEDMRALTREMRDKDWIRWQDNLAEQQERNERLFRDQARRLARLDSSRASRFEAGQIRRVDAIKRIQKLAMMGATTDLDTMVLKQDFESLMEGFEITIDAAVEMTEGTSTTLRSGTTISVRADSSGS
jgi:hypothetical protein